MGKLLIIGLDGLDPNVLDRHIEELPNFKKIANHSKVKKIDSIFPPDSIPAWISIFTGENPSMHGVINHIDYLNGEVPKLDTSFLQGSTFWDIAGKNNKKVCIINPFMSYPAWQVNGIMLSGPVFCNAEPSSNIKEAIKPIDTGLMGGIEDFPSEKDLDAFLKKADSQAEMLCSRSLDLINQQNYDLIFITFLTIDRIQHFLWRFTDEKDPTFPGKTKYYNAIKNHYKVIDKIIGKLIKAAGKGFNVMIISDHGHGMRCIKYFNLNEYLRLKGYLITTIKNPFDKKLIQEKIKHAVLRTSYKFSLHDLTYKTAKLIPSKNRKNIKEAKTLIDISKSTALLDDISGGNPFGGIRTNGKLDSKSIDNLIKDLLSIKYKEKPVFKWIMKRESKFNGNKLKKYPEIIYELESAYGVSRDLFCPLITPNYNHRKISGGHKTKAAFFLNEINQKSNRTINSIMDISPLVIDLLEK